MGAKQNTEAGLFYQWGAVSGHIDASEFAFTEASYNSQQLNLITEDLTLEHDAASVYFGDTTVRMPSRDDCNELFNPEFVTIRSKTINGVRGMSIQSRITGNSVFFANNMGRFIGSSYSATSYPHFWTKSYGSDVNAVAAVVDLQGVIRAENRWNGLVIRPVKKL